MPNHYTKVTAFVYTKTETSHGVSVLKRKKETADVELSRLLRKPGKQNGAGFF